MNRIYVYPWDQLSEGASAVAAALDTQKLLRKGSRYGPQHGDVIVNWGASDMSNWLYQRVNDADRVVVLNRDVSITIDKRTFFARCEGMPEIPKSVTIGKGVGDRVGMVRSMIAKGALSYPILCRTTVKGRDGAGIVIAETEAQLVDAPLYVQLEHKTGEYRVHVGRNRDGSASIIGVQQKFLPKDEPKGDKRLRTASSGCYFVWTLDGEAIKLPLKAHLAALSVFDKFPELDFGGFDIIYDRNRDEAFVIEINSAPEMTERSAKLYAEFFQQFRVDVTPEQVVTPYVAKLEAINTAAIDAVFNKWFAESDGEEEEYRRYAFRAGWQAALDTEMLVEIKPFDAFGDRIDVI